MGYLMSITPVGLRAPPKLTMEEELKLEKENLKSKIKFLQLHGPTQCFSDVVLLPCDSDSNWPPIPAHRAVLTSRSPVFKAMLENEMEESIIKITDASYNAFSTFINYLYTAEANLDEQMAFDLLVLAEKYQVMHLKTYCEEYLMSKSKWENSFPYHAFAEQHNAGRLFDKAFLTMMGNMTKISEMEGFEELLKKDPELLGGYIRAYISREKIMKKDPGLLGKFCMFIE